MYRLKEPNYEAKLLSQETYFEISALPVRSAFMSNNLTRSITREVAMRKWTLQAIQSTSESIHNDMNKSLTNM